jgi:hypothetical protein
VEENALELITQTLLYEPRIITSVLFAFPLNGNGRRYKPVSVALLKDQFMRTEAGRKIGMPASHEKRRGEERRALCRNKRTLLLYCGHGNMFHGWWGDNSAIHFPSALSLLCYLP